jgi:hypothetical protein
MPALKLKQLKCESDAWKRLLDFMTEENIHLKNRLSEILKDNFDRNLLERIDSFHGDFIKEDQLITLLRNSISELDKLFVKGILEDGKIFSHVNRQVGNVRNNIATVEGQFGKLKTDFHSYLVENL